MVNRSSFISQRGFVKLAGAVAAGSALAACTGTPALRASPTDSGPVQLVYQDWRTEWFPALAQEMLHKFNETHPKIRVFYTPDPDNLESKMPEDMAAGTAPDVFAGAGWEQEDGVTFVTLERLAGYTLEPVRKFEELRFWGVCGFAAHTPKSGFISIFG